MLRHANQLKLATGGGPTRPKYGRANEVSWLSTRARQARSAHLQAEKQGIKFAPAEAQESNALAGLNGQVDAVLWGVAPGQPRQSPGIAHQPVLQVARRQHLPPV